MSNLVSVIIPVYNSETYLDRCIKSIINQSYKKLEIILINDGSTDSSLDICKSYQQKDKRIKVLSQKNKGVSSARNYGIKKATGYYIMFVDSDDTITKNYIEAKVQAMNNKNVDAVISGYSIIDNNIKKVHYKNKDMFLSYNEYKYDLINKPSFSSICLGLYKTKWIKKNEFNENLIYVEDWLFSYNVLKEKNIYYLHNSGYYYYMNIGSAMHTYEFERIYKYIKDNFYVLDYIKKDNKNIKEYSDIINARKFTKLNYALIKLCYKEKITKREFKKYLSKIIPLIDFKISINQISYESKINKIRCYLLLNKKYNLYYILNRFIKTIKAN